MPVIAIYILIAAAVFGSGYATAWKTEQTQIAKLEAQIELSNESEKRKFDAALAQVSSAESDAAIASIQLESEHDKSVKLINNSRDSLSAIRMRVPTKLSNCSNTLSKSSSSSKPVATTGSTELPRDLEKLLRAESYRADTVAEYAGECFKFVKSNCGIK